MSQLQTSQTKSPTLSMTLKGLFKILRPYNSLLAGMATVIGIVIAIGFGSVGDYALETVLAALATAFIAAGGYVINDYFDLPIDLINQPHRPLPSQEVTPKQAYVFAMTLFGLGLVTSVILAVVEQSSLVAKLVTPLLALVGVVFLYTYGTHFKRVGGVGNLIVTLLVMIPFIFGGIIINQFEQSLYPIIVGFSLILGREIVKDVEDVEGDRQGSAQEGESISTLPMLIGVRPTVRLGQGLLLLLVILSPLAFVSDLPIYHSWGLLIAITIVDILALVATFNLRGTEEELISRATLSKRLLKSAMGIGALGLLLASVTPFSQLEGLL